MKESKLSTIPKPGTGWDLVPLSVLIVFVVFSVIPKRRKGEDHIIRNRRPRVWPPRVFALLRILNPIMCYWLLHSNRTLSPKDWGFVIMLAVAAVKQGYWAIFQNKNDFVWKLTIVVFLFNFVVDWTYAQCLLRRGPNQPVDPIAWIGISMFVFGIVVETYADEQREAFKSDPRNAGKVFTGGLFRYARHINYLGYISWRGGLGMVSGPPYTLAFALFHAIDFYFRAIPLLQMHMHRKYGKAWEGYTQSTKSVLIPGVV